MSAPSTTRTAGRRPATLGRSDGGDRPPAATPPAADHDAADDVEQVSADYRTIVGDLRRRYRRRARCNRWCANGVSLLQVAAGAAVGVTAGWSASLTPYLGVAVILLEGVSRVLRAAPRAARARHTVRLLDREIRLFDAEVGPYSRDDADRHPAFVAAVERILAHADAAEDRDELAGQGDVRVAPSRRRAPATG